MACACFREQKRPVALTSRLLQRKDMLTTMHMFTRATLHTAIRTSTDPKWEKLTMQTTQIADRDQDRQVFALLLDGFDQSVGHPAEQRWRWLTAAHVVGQNNFSMHWNSHSAMLRFALATRDQPEAAGQILRLALVPLGHLLHRLPAGNIGRATVNAFAPMALAPELARLIDEMRERSKSQESPTAPQSLRI